MAEESPRPDRIAALVVAAGAGLRAGQPLPKQFARWRGKPVVRHSVEALAAAGCDPVVVCIPAGADEVAAQALSGLAVRFITGGATRKADLGGLNLAAEVEDGRQVLVPVRAGAGAAGAAASAAAPAEGQPLNVNTATLEQLDGLTGVGPITAQKILDAREERGGFGSIEELGEIPGIGEKRLATLREEVTL